MVVERKQMLGSVSLMLRCYEILCGRFILEMVRFKLNDMNIWSEMGIAPQIKDMTLRMGREIYMLLKTKTVQA